MSVKIAVVQQEIRPGQVADNRERALAHVRQAVAASADIILLPEGMMVGYVENYRELAEAVDGPTTQAFQVLLSGTESLVLYGLTEKDADGYYLAATLVGGGGVVANYRKTHLWWADDGLRGEAAHFTPGQRLVTFDVQGHTSGVMICYDGDFPEMTRSYANLGCRMLFWMNHRPSRGPAETAPLAAGNSMILATSCCYGTDEGGRDCSGGSNVVNYDGSVLAELWNDEGVIYAEVEPDDVPARRRKNPWYHGRRPELYV